MHSNHVNSCPLIEVKLSVVHCTADTGRSSTSSRLNPVHIHHTRWHLSASPLSCLSAMASWKGLNHCITFTAWLILYLVFMHM